MAGEDIDPEGKRPRLVCHIAVWSSRPLDVCVCWLRFQLVSVLLREASFCCGQQLTQGLITAQSAERSDWWVLSPRWDICVTPSDAQGTWQKRQQERCRSWEIRRSALKTIFRNERGHQSSELIAVWLLSAQGLDKHSRQDGFLGTRSSPP